MQDNYYALTIAIVRGLPPEHALATIAGEQAPFSITFADEMIFFRDKEKLSWKEVGEIFGIRAATAYRTVKRFRQGGGISAS